jgi:hypothetical protein
LARAELKAKVDDVLQGKRVSSVKTNVSSGRKVVAGFYPTVAPTTVPTAALPSAPTTATSANTSTSTSGTTTTASGTVLVGGCGEALTRSELLATATASSTSSTDTSTAITDDTPNLITQSAAMKKYLLPPSSLSLLPYTPYANPSGEMRADCKMYLEESIEKIAMETWGSFENIEKERGRREEVNSERRREKILGEGGGGKRRKK